jgi:hypothetical protein
VRPRQRLELVTIEHVLLVAGAEEEPERFARAGGALDLPARHGWGLDPGITGPFAGAARRAGLVLLAPWLLFQGMIAVGSFALAYRYPFSDTKAAARMLAPEARLVTDTNWRSTGVMFWRPDVQARDLALGAGP